MPPNRQHYNMHECCKAVNGAQTSNDKCHIPLVRDPHVTWRTTTSARSPRYLAHNPQCENPPLPGAHLKQVTDSLVRGTHITTKLPGAPPSARTLTIHERTSNTTTDAKTLAKTTSNLCDGHRLYNHIRHSYAQTYVQPIAGYYMFYSSIHNIYPIFG